MTTELTTPAPDLTALADVHDAARAWMLHCLSYLDEVITLDCVVDTLLSDLAIGGFEITRATAPDAGRVTISERTRWAALDALRDRERDYQHARELDPHYAATVQCGSAWSAAIAELTGLAQAGEEGNEA